MERIHLLRDEVELLRRIAEYERASMGSALIRLIYEGAIRRRLFPPYPKAEPDEGETGARQEAGHER